MQIFNFDDVQFIFPLVAYAFGAIFKKPLSDTRSQRYISVFFLRILQFQLLTFRSWIHFELIFVDDMRQGFKFILLQVDIQLSQHLVCFIIYQFILKDLMKYTDEEERRARSGRVPCGKLLPPWNLGALPSQHVVAFTILEAPQHFLLKRTIFSPHRLAALSFKKLCVYVCVSVAHRCIELFLNSIPFYRSVCLPFCQYCVVSITVALQQVLK